MLKIVKEIESIRKEHPDDCYGSGGREVLISLVSDSVLRSNAIILVLPSCPFKSQNRDNTLGDLPDIGEYIALEVFNSLCDNIKKVYDPGVDFVLASDGRLYIEIVMEEVKKDKDYLRLYIGFQNFALSEIKAQKLDCSNREMVKRAKSIAKKMMVRNFANAKLLKESFPSMIRLSVKHHDTRKGLFAVNLMRTHTDIGTPWLNCIVRMKDGRYRYIKGQEAKELEYKEMRKEDRGYMFIE